jgi:formate/nitrite transporter FocA (FNT family)
MNTLRSSILSGIAIGIAGWGYLVTNNIVGAVLFSFGLLTVIQYKIKLYTGTAGFVPFRNEQGNLCVSSSIFRLLYILFGNILGC